MNSSDDCSGSTMPQTMIKPPDLSQARIVEVDPDEIFNV